MNPLDVALQDLPPPKPIPRPTPAPTPVDRVDALAEMLQRDEEERRKRLQQSIAQGKDLKPDQAASVIDVQRKTGWPAPVVTPNLSQAQSLVEQRSDTLSRMIKDSPDLAKWLAEDATRAAAAKDDLHSLGFMDWLFTAPGRQIRQVKAQEEYADLWEQRRRTGALTPAQQKRLDELDGEIDIDTDSVSAVASAELASSRS